MNVELVTWVGGPNDGKAQRITAEGAPNLPKLVDVDGTCYELRYAELGQRGPIYVATSLTQEEAAERLTALRR